jgi:hypothetical protein
MRRFASARGVLANRIRLAVPFGFFCVGKVGPAHAQNAVCVDVKIEQKLSLERWALDALTRVNNGLQAGAPQNVGINFTFRFKPGKRRCRDLRREHLMGRVFLAPGRGENVCDDTL